MLESALKQGGLSVTGFEDAEDAGLVQQVHGTVVFRHPLVRSAAYRCATRSERQAATGPWQRSWTIRSAGPGTGR